MKTNRVLIASFLIAIFGSSRAQVT
ncbi:MAG: hypothetical protein RL220_1284, partial [Bacteroidota bacterium]